MLMPILLRPSLYLPSGVLIPLLFQVAVVAQTVQCLEALIRPLVWPHTYVPVVPDNLCDLAHNPTPYLMGILRWV